MPLIIGLACAAGVFLGSFLNFPAGKQDFLQSNSNKEKLKKLIDYIDYDYVDKVNTDSIVDITIANILKDLDPHSTYIPKNQIQEIQEEMNGDFVGIGIQFFKIEDTIAVVRTIKDGPGEKAGIKAGDRLVYVNENTALYGPEFDLGSLRQYLRGEENSSVDLKVKRRGIEDLLNIKVSRAHIPLKSVDASYPLNSSLGYVKINRFSKTTYDEFEHAIKQLEKEGIKDLVLDLRGNGGGYLKEAVKIADEFLQNGELIVFTKDNKGRIKETYATEKGDFRHAKVYVLIDQNSASASEVVAGALQDNDAATIIGRRSYGKGLVQREMDLGDGSAVRLTVARYFTPTGRSIQKAYKGETPQDYHHDFLERYQNGELVNEDSIHQNDSLRFTTPKGKIVYGGGGIVPDIFVPKDISYKKESLDYMLNGGMLDRFAFEYLDKNRNYYNGLSKEEFLENVIVDEEMLASFAEFLEGFKLTYRTQRYLELLKVYLKASLARQLFDTNTYEQILSTEDTMMQKVLEIYQQDTQMEEEVIGEVPEE